MTKAAARLNAEEPGKQLIGGIETAIVDGWKNKYGADDVKIIEVDLDVEGKRTVSCYARKPDFDILSAASAVSGQPLKSAQILFDNCYLGGDPETRENKEVKFAVMQQMRLLFQIKTARIKNA